MNHVERDPARGLTPLEVAERVERGLVNERDLTTSRSVRDIVRANVLTRFNAIVAALAAVVLVFGHPIDALFGIVMVANTVIGIGQELRAKKTLDDLTVLIAPSVLVVRDGAESELPVDELVLDDTIRLRAGDQVPVDARVEISEGLEVDESALTGESDPVAKRPGDEIRSGSAVVAGAATITATRVGREAWIHRLVEEAKVFVLTHSELRAGVDRILRWISWVLVPLAGLLFWSQLRNSADFDDGMVAAAAGVVALVPQGLVLLVSVAMAVAVVGLARRSVVVQELPAVETLARADVVCLDKTGTLTTGRTRLEAIEPVGALSRAAVEEGLAALAAAEASPTSAMQTIATGLGVAPRWEVTGRAPFSSDRKWSAATFDGADTWILGAPEVVLASVRSDVRSILGSRVSELTGQARRVLLVARSPEPLPSTDLGADRAPALPAEVDPVALAVMAEELRVDAAETMEYFLRQGVAVKIISGDNATTVAAVGRELGIPGADDVIDLRTVEEITPEVAADHTIFGRVSPEQKQQLVSALQMSGRTVAMTGDGVNDIPALKRADIGIAMDTATSATKAVAQLVLLNGRFDLLPGVVAEGRRVVANMERVSSLFLTKTTYAALFALFVGATGVRFPFLPRHLTVIDSITIGIPAFLLSFRAASDPCREGYLRRVLHFAVPAGIVAGAVTLTTYVLAIGPLGVTSDERRTLATVALTLMGLWIIYLLVRPLDILEAALIASLAAAFAIVLAWPAAAEFFALELPDAEAVAASLAVVAVGIVVLQVFSWRHWLDDPVS